MPNNKNQHFVPQFFLKNFSADKKCVSMCLKDSGGIIHNVSIRQQCSKAYFYPDQEYEKALGSFEGDCRNAISKVISGDLRALNQKDYSLFRLFLLLQMTRTQHKVRVFRGGIEQFRNHLNMTGITNDLKVKYDAFENSEKNIVGLLMSTFRNAIETTSDLRCKVLVYEGKGDFITSDDPVVQYNPLLEPYKIRNYGLAAMGLLLILPISPKYAIVLYDDLFYKIGHRKESIVRFTNTNDLYWINLLTVLHADKAIYYLPGSFTQNEISTLVNRAKITGQDEAMKMEKYTAEDGRSELMHFYINNYAIGAQFSFLKKLDRARELHFGDTIGVVDYTRRRCLQLFQG